MYFYIDYIYLYIDYMYFYIDYIYLYINYIYFYIDYMYFYINYIYLYMKDRHFTVASQHLTPCQVQTGCHLPTIGVSYFHINAHPAVDYSLHTQLYLKVYIPPKCPSSSRTPFCLKPLLFYSGGLNRRFTPIFTPLTLCLV